MHSSDKGKRLSPAEWAEIRNRYIAGEMVKSLASEFNVSREAISRRASREAWKRSDEIIEEAAQELEQEIKADWKAQARESNLQQFKAWQYVAGIAIGKLKEIKEGRLAGRAAYELASLANSLKVAFDGMRLTMAMDTINSPFIEDDNTEDMGDVERLLKIMTPVPPAPQDLKAEVVGRSQTSLSWVDRTGGVDRFRIERAEARRLAFSAVGTVQGNVTGYLDKKVVPGNTYVYRVVAVSDERGESFPSETASVSLPVSTSLQAA